jgi:hypothetical protein
VITPHDIERYMNAQGAQQGMDAMHEDFHRWIRQLRARGLGDVPLALGSESARHLDQMITDWLPKHRPTRQARLWSHDIHETMPELRPHKRTLGPETRRPLGDTPLGVFACPG